jgi:hypothetical protein
MYYIQRIDENGTVQDKDPLCFIPMSRDVAEWRRTLLASRSTDTFILVPIPDDEINGGEE